MIRKPTIDDFFLLLLFFIGLTRKLNEQQLRRLHMVLKPFMLRRVKRDVENEMASKIEKEVISFLFLLFIQKKT